MKIMNPSQLLYAIERQGSGTDHIEFSRIDATLYFMPESLTQLYHTPVYAKLDDAHRLRYNQLFALRTSEQLMSLEEYFIEQVLKHSQGRKSGVHANELLECMKVMVWEETTHYAMFAKLNRHSEAKMYAEHDYYFATMSSMERAALKVMPYMPGIRPFLLWLLMILEEFSTAISKKMIHHQHCHLLEPNFVLAHKAHLKDESRHVHICGNLLTQFLEDTSPISRKINVHLLRKFMCDYMTPKRGGMRVIEQLVREFPGLSCLKDEMLLHIRAQKQDKVIWEAIQNPKDMPVTHLLFDRFPEFRFYHSPAISKGV